MQDGSYYYFSAESPNIFGLSRQALREMMTEPGWPYLGVAERISASDVKNGWKRHHLLKGYDFVLRFKTDLADTQKAYDTVKEKWELKKSGYKYLARNCSHVAIEALKAAKIDVGIAESKLFPGPLMRFRHLAQSATAIYRVQDRKLV